MGRVDIFRLETGQTYRLISSSRETDLLDYVHDQSSQKPRAYLMPRMAITQKRAPVKLDSWGDLVEYSPPEGERASQKEMVIVHGDDGIALGLGNPITKAERKKLLEDVELVAVQRAQAHAGRDSQAGIMEKVMMLLAGSVALVTVVICVLALGGYLSSDSAPDVADEAATQEDGVVGPPPTPTPAPPWQNPRPSPLDDAAQSFVLLMPFGWAWQRFRRWRAKKALEPPREVVVVFDNKAEDIYRVSLPTQEIYDNLPPNVRYVCPSLNVVYAGTAVSAVLVGILSWCLLWWALGNPVLAMIIATPVAFIAAVVAWIGIPKLNTQPPHWLATRDGDGELEEYNIGGFLSNDDPEASFTGELLEMRDLRDLLTDKGGKGRLAIQIGSVAVLLICSMAILFLVVAVVG